MHTPMFGTSAMAASRWPQTVLNSTPSPSTTPFAAPPSSLLSPLQSHLSPSSAVHSPTTTFPLPISAWPQMFNAPRAPFLDPSTSMASLPPSSSSSRVPSPAPAGAAEVPRDALGLWGVPLSPRPSSPPLITTNTYLSPHIPTNRLCALPYYDAGETLDPLVLPTDTITNEPVIFPLHPMDDGDALWAEGQVRVPVFPAGKKHKPWPYGIYARDMAHAFNLIGPAKARDNGIVERRYAV